jgi:gliding motility-associated-like protein
MLCAIFIALANYSQCDVELSLFDWDSGDIQVIVHNSNGCGNGEDTLYISHLDFGVSNGIDILNDYEFANFPFHSFLDFQETHFGNGYGVYAYSGDTLDFNMSDALNANSGLPSVLNKWMGWYNDGTFCSDTEVFIWQINYSNAPQALDSTWYNSFGTSQDYPDDNPWDNILPVNGICPCDTIFLTDTDTIELIEYVSVIEYLTDTINIYVCADTVEIIEYVYETIYENIYITDTIIEYVDVEWITIDTLYITEVDTLIEYVQLPPDTIVLVDTDTIIEFEYVYLTDTMYLETVVYEYIHIYNTDTITEYNTETVYIDCDTGELCGGDFICDETSIFAPNAVTPNGDGWNDTWQVLTDGECWSQWEVRIYNRWGGLVWISASSLDEWDAFVATGVYVYTITAHSSQNGSVFEFNGTVTVLY